MRRSGLAVAFIGLLAAGALVAQEGPSSCIACHSDGELFDEASLLVVEHFESGVHAAAGLGCHDCHGGNPSSELADDYDAAMDEGYGPNPYRGVPQRAEIPGFCGGCHSDPDYMKRFRPDARVDQEQEYRTSQHGRSLAAGDLRVATCIDCHGSHGTLPPGDPASRVYPTRVAETCGTCHSDAEHMEASGLATDQEARWRHSVHARALLEKGDLSAPTCNDCHGNHGAVPPGVESIVFVCGQCHGREARLFRDSPKHAGFEEHNEYLEGLEGDCAACHEAPEPQAELSELTSFSECTTCHGNHAVVRPTVAMLGELPATPCAFCHEGAGPLTEEVPEPEAKKERYEEVRDQLLAAAAEAGVEGEARFDRLVDRALTLPEHTFPASEGEAPRPRPEFKRLFEKFRIGKTSFLSGDGVGAVPIRVSQCGDCHAAEPILAGEPVGHGVARAMLAQMRELTALTARAERILVTARRGGVETREALAEIEKAVDAQIGLEVLVHTFEVGEGSAFAERQQEGLEHARAALEAGRGALDELAFRRRGLAIALIFIALFALALGLKIRQISAR